MARISMGHYVVGVEGVALLRHWLVGSRELADRRVREIAQFVARPDEPPLAIELEAPEEDVQGGYARWAGTYDATPNPLIRLEQPVVREMIDHVPPGRALDAACGTGRHTQHLHSRGHDVIGVDASAAMLEQARVAVPGAAFRIGQLTALPVQSATMDLVVCALALTHCPDLEPPVDELARVLQRGGRLVLSDFHPLLVSLGGSAFFVGSDGRAGHVRSYTHSHSAYLRAFRRAGLEVVDCVEPVNGDEEVALMSAGMLELAPEAFFGAFRGLPGALVWELVRG